MIGAGKRDRKVLIEQPTDAIGTRGDVTQSWTTYKTWWARKVQLPGGERFDADQRYATGAYRWEGLYVPGVTAKMRINEGGTYYDIEQPPIEIGRQKETHLITVQRSA